MFGGHLPYVSRNFNADMADGVVAVGHGDSGSPRLVLVQVQRNIIFRWYNAKMFTIKFIMKHEI